MEITKKPPMNWRLFKAADTDRTCLFHYTASQWWEQGGSAIMQAMNPFVYYIVLITVLDVAGCIAAKNYSLAKNPLFLALTVVFFGGAGFVFAKSLKYEGMAITNVLWIALSVIVVTLIGYFYFKENISGLQMAGIVVITVGLIMVNLE